MMRLDRKTRKVITKIVLAFFALGTFQFGLAHQSVIAFLISALLVTYVIGFKRIRKVSRKSTNKSKARAH